MRANAKKTARDIHQTFQLEDDLAKQREQGRQKKQLVVSPMDGAERVRLLADDTSDGLNLFNQLSTLGKYIFFTNGDHTHRHPLLPQPLR